MSYKKVHFHKMSYYDTELSKVKGKADEVKKKPFSEKCLNEKLESLMDNELEENCLVLGIGTNQKTLEIIKRTDEYIFAKLGRMQDIKNVHFRNKKTLKSSPIEKAIDQEIEIFTHLLIHRNNMVVTYITEMGAPYIISLEQLTKRYPNKFEDTELIEVTPIIVPDALAVLKNKKTISRMNYKVTLPINELFDKDHLDLQINEYVNQKDLKTANIEITITGQKNKNIVDNAKDNLDKLVQKITKNKFGKTEQISFNAKNDDEYTHTYNVFDEFFVRKTKMDMKQIDNKIKKLNMDDDDYYDNVQNLIHEEIEQKLLSVYNSNKEELSQYNRNTPDT